MCSGGQTPRRTEPHFLKINSDNNCSCCLLVLLVFVFFKLIQITIHFENQLELYHAVLTVSGEETSFHSREVLKVNAEHLVLLRYVNDLCTHRYMTR
jgi:hypothetical protein